LALITTALIAGGDIAPVEPVVTDPVVAESGDAMNTLFMGIMFFATMMTGLYFTKKEMREAA